jgi:microcystin-dependent protein
MAEPFLSEIRVFSFNFAPKGWATCDGQALPINQNQSLYSLLGTTYGGNGTTTFCLPDLRGRTPLHFGPEFVIGESGGSESVTLVVSEMPYHSHSLMAAASTPTANTPADNLLTTLPVDKADFASPSVANGYLNPAAIAATGGSVPHNNMQPSLVLNFSIALVGVFPSRN